MIAFALDTHVTILTPFPFFSALKIYFGQKISNDAMKTKMNK